MPEFTFSVEPIESILDGELSAEGTLVKVETAAELEAKAEQKRIEAEIAQQLVKNEEEQETIIIIAAGNTIILLVATISYFIYRRKKTKMKK